MFLAPGGEDIQQKFWGVKGVKINYIGPNELFQRFSGVTAPVGVPGSASRSKFFFFFPFLSSHPSLHLFLLPTARFRFQTLNLAMEKTSKAPPWSLGQSQWLSLLLYSWMKMQNKIEKKLHTTKMMKKRDLCAHKEIKNTWEVNAMSRGQNVLLTN